MGASGQSDGMEGIDDMEGRYLTFWTDGQMYGLPIADVVQIIRMEQITAIPEFPDYVKGVISLRGMIVPVIDVRIRFHKPEAAYTDYTCIIIAGIKGNLFGFVVDRVAEVTDKISPELISKPPQIGNEGANQYLKGVVRMEGRLILMIVTSQILGEQELEDLTQAAKEMSSGGQK